MDLDVLYEIDVPQPSPGSPPHGRRGAEQRAYREAAEQIGDPRPLTDVTTDRVSAYTLVHATAPSTGSGRRPEPPGPGLSPTAAT
ncbi:MULTISPECIES: hypothetical protein [Streptomyces]|uniref:Uncharacterized protein n=1 Tax=Streptomyces virginiae TaxID=1961 RepID=A0ABZ1TJQ0_STRVG|nr:hypothetical protein [Streptomyces virginiae]